MEQEGQWESSTVVWLRNSMDCSFFYDSHVTFNIYRFLFISNIVTLAIKKTIIKFNNTLARSLFGHFSRHLSRQSLLRIFYWGSYVFLLTKASSLLSLKVETIIAKWVYLRIGTLWYTSWEHLYLKCFTKYQWVEYVWYNMFELPL